MLLTLNSYNVFKKKLKNIPQEIKIHKASFSRLPFADNSLDGCVSVNTLYHGMYKDVVCAIKEMERVLMRGGWFYGTFLSKEDGKYLQGKKIAEDTFLSCEGPDCGVSHWFTDSKNLEKLFVNWDILRINHEIDKINLIISAHWKIVAKLKRKVVYTQS